MWSSHKLLQSISSRDGYTRCSRMTVDQAVFGPMQESVRGGVQHGRHAELRQAAAGQGLCVIARLLWWSQ